MADVGLVIIAVDGLWSRFDRVAPADRNTVLRVATAGVPVATWTRDGEDSLAVIGDMLRFQPIRIWGPGYSCHVKGRTIADGLAQADALLDRLVDHLARDPLPFGRSDVLLIGSHVDDAPLLASAGVTAWVPVDAEPPRPVDFVSHGATDACPGVAWALETLVLHNNRFLR